MPLDISKHKNILLRILKDIYTDTTIASLLGFKGRTAVYLFYNLSRFSLDLDFDILDEEKGNYLFERAKEVASQVNM